MMSEIFSASQVCPNMTDFKIRGSEWDADYKLTVYIGLTLAGVEFDGWHSL